MKALIILICFVSVVVPKDTHNEFDYKESSPIDLLDYLCHNNDKLFFVVNPDSIPEDWLNMEILPELMKRVRSDRITSPVFSINASVDLTCKIRTTEGVEAAFMIESIRKGKEYPPDLSSQNYGALIDGVFYPDTLLVTEIEEWLNELQNIKKIE